MMQPILSICVIAHNQKEYLPRCLSSLINQKISQPYEIIISDDKSTDGTWELIEHYVQEYPDLIKASQCVSDDCGPVNISERCGWNKLNAYSHASGKYIVNVDADDFILSDDIYEEQIKLLEKHPECSLCMQKTLSYEEGSDISSAQSWPNNPILKNEAIIGINDFLKNRIRGLNQSYMMRRHDSDDMGKLYGKWFDDTVITMHYLQYGNIVYINRADYVWVQYSSSISHSIPKIDSEIVYGLLPVHHALLIPAIGHYFIKNGLPELIHLMKVLSKHSGKEMRTDYFNYVSEFNGFIYDWITTDRHSVAKRIRFSLLRTLLIGCNSFGLMSRGRSEKLSSIIWKLII